MLFFSESSFFESRLAKSVNTIVAEELMLVAMVDMPAEKSEAITSPVSPVGSPWTMNHGNTWSEGVPAGSSSGRAV